MTDRHTLNTLTEDMASIISSVDSQTTGQYGDGITSESEERQIELILPPYSSDYFCSYANQDLRLRGSVNYDTQYHKELLYSGNTELSVNNPP